jgi:outer membrane protein assembly complex protein YaeT
MLVGLGVLAGAAARAQETPPPTAARTIAAIEVDGAVDVSQAYIRSLIHTRVGDAYDPAAIDDDVARLLRSGKFLAVSATVGEADGRVTVTFHVSERPRIREIRFVGNQRIKEKDLLGKLPFKVGDPVDLFSVREGREAILAAYREKGYGSAAVEFDDALLRRESQVLYTIEEGPHVRVRRIQFEGNTAFPDEELQKHVTTETYLWIFREGKFDADTVAGDAAAIQNFYRDQGYLDARASYRLAFSPNRTDLTVVFIIEEGTRYFIEDIRFTGNTVFTNDELAIRLSSKPGDAVLERRLEADQRTLEMLYGDRGYIERAVTRTRVFSATPGRVIITFDIKEGEPFTVGRIVVRGNEHTKDKVVRRALSLYPGDVFNQTEMRAAEQKLIETRIFSSASVTPVGEQPEQRDIVINVEEAPKAGDLLFGVGVTSNSGLVGSVIIDIKNFDLFDWPRSFSEFIRFRSFRGAGQRLRLEAEPGTQVSRFRVDFTEPYFLDKPITFGLSAYYYERRRSEYNEQRIGTSVSFGKRLRSGPLKNWFGEVAFRAEGIDISHLHLFSARDVRDSEGSHVLTSVKGTLVRDRTDNRIIPTRGDRFRLSYEQVLIPDDGGAFGRINADYERHWTTYVDVQDRKSVLSVKAEAGYIAGDAPIYERYYAGGIGSLRGFEFRGISPRQGLRHDAIGGDFLLLTGAEYSFPLVAETLRGVTFLDMGTVERDFGLTTWRAAIGFGIRLHIDFFGPVPLEFDFAAPLLREHRDEQQVFSFFIGATF